LLSGKRRARGVIELSHADCIDKRFATAWVGADPRGLLDRLNKLRAVEDCYVIFNAEALDDRMMKLADALGEITTITAVKLLPSKKTDMKDDHCRDGCE
jgi:hypothetical protein